MKKLYAVLLLAIASSGYAQVTLNIEGPNIACPNSCVELTAEYTGLSNTTSYSVSSIPYQPLFPFTGGTVMDAFNDDAWSSYVNLPFNFNFYGSNYNQLLVGTNGVITFDIVNQFPLLACQWSFAGAIPNTGFDIKNAIYGAYQDTDIRQQIIDQDAIPNHLQNVNYYILDTGANATPNRAFVANFNQLPQFSCNASVGMQTSQIVIYESTNIIEVYIGNRTPCATWNAGAGVIGIQNANATHALAAPGRNTGTWSATNEAWRFTPNGEAITPTILWFENGNGIGAGETISVCPTQGTNYSATLTYTGSPVLLEDQMDIAIFNEPLGVPFDLQVCGDGPTYWADLTTNMSLVLGAVDPDDYEITFYDDANAAELQLMPIGDPSSYAFTDPEIMYMGVQHLITGCYEVMPFSIEGFPTPDAPTGSATQVFIPGQTLASLVVSGQNVLWYDAATDGNLLPPSTPLADGTTYYASQTVSGCESRMLSSRLAVTAVLTLGTAQFKSSDIRLYPNPAEQTLTVSLQQNIDGIEILNVLGQTVAKQAASGKEIKLDVSALSGGSYFLKINIGSDSVISKFIKK